MADGAVAGSSKVKISSTIVIRLKLTHHPCTVLPTILSVTPQKDLLLIVSRPSFFLVVVLHFSALSLFFLSMKGRHIVEIKNPPIDQIYFDVGFILPAKLFHSPFFFFLWRALLPFALIDFRLGRFRNRMRTQKIEQPSAACANLVAAASGRSA